MSSLKTIVLSVFLMMCLPVRGQHVDAVQLDLKHLSGIEFFTKYSLYDSSTNNEDIKITKLIWSLHHLRKINNSLRQKGVKTITIINNRPSKGNGYYIIGHYQDLPETDHLFRMSFYRINILTYKVDYQRLDDYENKRWKRVN